MPKVKGKKSSMPTYVIIEKREFEELFEKVERDGDRLTALNSSTKSLSHKDTRFSSSKPYSKEKRKRRHTDESSEEQKRRKHAKKFESRSESGGEEEVNQTKEICEAEDDESRAVRNYGQSSSSESSE